MFSGSIPALVTPFRDGALDEAAFRRFIDWQIEEGSSALVPCGTTGENPTLTDAERLRIDVQEFHDGHPEDEATRELVREYRAVVEEILELRGDDGRISAFVRSITEPGVLAQKSRLVMIA